MVVKTVNLKGVYDDKITQLERLHYETYTKERLLALVISMSQAPTEIIENRYEDYLKSYQAYDFEKEKFFTDIVSQYVEDARHTWEINFSTGVLSFYD